VTLNKEIAFNHSCDGRYLEPRLDPYTLYFGRTEQTCNVEHQETKEGTTEEKELSSNEDPFLFGLNGVEAWINHDFVLENDNHQEPKQRQAQ